MKIMDNPGLTRHGQPRPFLKVTSRRYASDGVAVTNPVMDNPLTTGYDGYENSIDPPGPHTESVTTPPPLAGGATQMPVPATNGELVQDRTPNFEHRNITGAAAPTQVIPTRIQNPVNPNLNRAQQMPAMTAPAQQAQQQMWDQAKREEDTRVAEQKSDGRQVNPAYDAAQERITQKMQERLAHPLHQPREA